MLLDQSLNLYLVTHDIGVSEEQFLSIIEESLKGGVTAVQLRDKNLSDESYKALAIKCKELTDKYQIPFFVNDRAYIAKEIGANGIHIGQSDCGIDEVRTIFGNKVIGISVSNLSEAIKAEKSNADYISIGPIFKTSTKLDAAPPIGIDELKNIKKRITKPLVVIGGININNVGQILSLGIKNIALSSAIFSSQNPTLASRAFLNCIRK